MVRRVYDGIGAYRRYRRNASRESVIILAIAGIIVSTADGLVGIALAWGWPSAGEHFNAMSKNLPVAMSGLPLALLWLAAAFGSDWRRAAQRGDLERESD